MRSVVLTLGGVLIGIVICNCGNLLPLTLLLYIAAWWRYAPVERWWGRLLTVIIGVPAGVLFPFGGAIAVILVAVLLRSRTA